MLTTRLNFRRAARIIRRCGFTHVELLVVIGIIAILAGVALGPITNGIKKAKQSSSMQTAHVVGLAMYSYANDNSQQYPDSTATTAADPVKELLAGGYISDASIFFISGGTASKYVGTTASAASSITAANISWDFAGKGDGTGLSSTSYQYMPIVWTSVGTGTQPALTATQGTAITCVPTSTGPMGTDGVAVFYINNSSKFINGTLGTVTMVTTSNNSGEGSGSGAKALLGGG
jgi:prepilin-type N-terminal cleavage/methylation domain-containing protein